MTQSVCSSTNRCNNETAQTTQNHCQKHSTEKEKEEDRSLLVRGLISSVAFLILFT